MTQGELLRAFERYLTGPPVSVGPVKSENFVKVGDIENPEDEAQGYGRVDYEFYISKFEVTVGEYAAFLNSAAKSDANGLYHPNMAIDQNGTDLATDES